MRRSLGSRAAGHGWSWLQRTDRDPLVCTTPVFLDHETGDAFRFDRTRDVWAPYANVGLTRRDILAQKHTYRPKEGAHKLVEQLFTSKRHDVPCRIDVSCLHHWACKHVNREFLVPVWGRWKLELQSIRVRVPSFAVLAKAPWGPLVRRRQKKRKMLLCGCGCGCGCGYGGEVVVCDASGHVCHGV